jgi:2-polyprenyl-6-hydroxyphenyl methylase/3-demethylubiquinone-9 3-methyltransferase
MTTVNKDEIQKFSDLADQWWDVNGKFKPLHMFNPIRIEYILAMIAANFKLDRDKKLFLQNTSILDIGCGGGLISEPLSRLGANVTGIDASKKNIQVASLHSKKNNLKIKYIQSSPEQMNTDEKFDVILNLEIVEHVENLDLYLNSCSSLLKKGGVMFTATINRTLVSYIKAIVGAEYILRWLPVGTHDWNKFVKPEELENKFDKLKLCIIDTSGLSYNPISKKWKKSSDLSVNYIITTKKI